MIPFSFPHPSHYPRSRPYALPPTFVNRGFRGPKNTHIFNPAAGLVYERDIELRSLCGPEILLAAGLV